MNIKSIDLSWIVVKDLKKAVKFYTDVVGLKLMELNEQFGWAELRGHEGGSILGIAQYRSGSELEAGQNAVVTLSVDNIESAIKKMVMKGANCIGEIHEVAGHVKMQSVVDVDGNHFQIVQVLSKKDSHKV